MSDVFPVVQLGQVIEHRKEFIQISDVDSYKRCRVQLHAKGIVLRDTVSGIQIKTKKQQVCRAGEFLVAEIDAKVGGFGIVPDDLDGAIVSSHYFLFEVNDSVLDRRFLDYFVRTPGFRDQVSAQGSTNYAAIRPRDVLSYQIPLPPLNEQRRIVARIEELAAKIEEAQTIQSQASAEVYALKGAVLRETFERDAERFGTCPIGDVCTTTSGGTPSRRRPDYFDGDIPWVKSGELEDRPIRRADEHISEAAVAESSAKVFPAGTLLVALYGATVGRTGLLEIDAATNQAVCAIFPREGLDPDYLWWFFQRMRPEFISQSFGGAQPNISQTIIRATVVPTPPITHQRCVVTRLSELDHQLDTVRNEQSAIQAELSALLPAVLDQAFKGEL